MTDLETELRALHDTIDGDEGGMCGYQCLVAKALRDAAALGRAAGRAEAFEKAIGLLDEASKEMTRGSPGRAPIPTVRSAFASEFAVAIRSLAAADAKEGRDG